MDDPDPDPDGRLRAGSVASVFLHPVELVKVRMQAGQAGARIGLLGGPKAVVSIIKK
jgi:hypothetical protein